jgi:hypothetical protein
VIHLAIAAESLVREVVIIAHAKHPVSAEFRSLTNQVSISRVIDRWKHLGFDTRSWRRAVDLPALKHLFELRNRLMHKADSILDQTECAKLARNVCSLVVHGSGYVACYPGGSRRDS